MPTINMEPLLKDIVLPIVIKMILPTVVLIIVFGIIKILVLRKIDDRKTHTIVKALINLIFLVAFAIIGIPATQLVIGSINLKDYTVPDEVISHVSLPEPSSSISAEEYFQPFFEAFEKEWAKQEEQQKDENTDNSSENDDELSKEERYAEYKRQAQEIWDNRYPEYERDEEAYQEYLKQVEEIWNNRYGIIE